MTTIALRPGRAWRKSRRSQQSGACVEVARNLPEGVAVRDSKDRHGPVLIFAPHEWQSFIDGVKARQFNLT